MSATEDFILGAMYDYLHSRLDQLQEEKAQTNVMPNMVTKAELFAAIDRDSKRVLNRMFKDKKIKVHKTIHAPIQDFVELVSEEEIQ